jgi:hypothetical protein
MPSADNTNSRAGHLKSQKLQAVAVANTGYLPGKVNFAVRRARRNVRPQDVDLLELLKTYAAKTDSLKDKLLDGREDVQFAKGHREATGGSMPPEVWEEFCRDGLQILEKPVAEEVKKREAEEGKHKITLDHFFSATTKKVKEE